MLGWIVLIILIIAGIAWWIDAKTGTTIVIPQQPQLIEWLSPEERIANGYQGVPCEICDGNTGMNPGSSDTEDYYDYICPSCRSLYDVQLKNRRHPPEVIELLDSNPEYEAKLPSKDILMLRTWKKYHIIERKYHEGKISEAEYNKQYAENVRWQMNHMELVLYNMKEKEADAARPKYDPTQHSRF